MEEDKMIQICSELFDMKENWASLSTVRSMTRGNPGFFLLLTLFALLVCMVLIGPQSISVQKVEKIKEQSQAPEWFNELHEPSTSFNPLDSKWEGGIVSKNNVLYKELARNQIGGFSCQIEKSVVAKFSSPAADILSLFEIYIPLFGYNNIIDCLAHGEIELSSDQSHALGIILVAYGARHDIPPKHMIEVNTRYLLHLAPLHGVIWSLIQGHNESDSVPFARSLCDFQDSEKIGGVWRSCVHGIGHGFSERFGYEGREKAIELCSMLDNDLDWIYSCATGVFMKMNNELTWRTCMDTQYPAACFGYLPKNFFGNNMCEKIVDEYRIRGCIWGNGNVSAGKQFLEAHIMCEAYNQTNYYHVCLDGYFHKISWESSEEEKEYCTTTIQGDLAQEVCLYYNSFQRTNHNAKKIAWFRPEILEIN